MRGKKCSRSSRISVHVAPESLFTFAQNGCSRSPRICISQETLAHDADVERNYISLLELGRNSASVKMIFKLAPALGITVSEFMALVEAKHKDGQRPKRGK